MPDWAINCYYVISCFLLKIFIMKKNNYNILFLSLGISFFIMYGVMFLNVDRLSHIYLSATRFYMALLMVAPMAIVMIGLMWKMFPNKKANVAIIAASIIIFASALALLRTQTPIGDIQYMKAMIPHHSSAILTSQEADIKDPEVKALSEAIIKAQEREIEQMKTILKRLEK